ncbi:unnamed protein product [Gongylonema pulchrum]|uniref:Uncharacterized protein n=1 Tax=Gongylonema pulchrum TaxID=637853 RepID=A0A183DEJ0_9BILA|nr:unnamed protein product [Gongylonema pulchrum]
MSPGLICINKCIATPSTMRTNSGGLWPRSSTSRAIPGRLLHIHALPSSFHPFGQINILTFLKIHTSLTMSFRDLNGTLTAAREMFLCVSWMELEQTSHTIAWNEILKKASPLNALTAPLHLSQC